MEKAIKQAIEGGWNGDSARIAFNNAQVGYAYQISQALLDPLFWQALGKAEGWSDAPYEYIEWRRYWHDFIDHLSYGDSVESFFNNLLK